MLYLISYDLDKPGKDYSGLTSALKRMGAKKVLFSEWVVDLGNTSCVALRDSLRSLIDSNDRLLITKVSDWASWNTMVDINTL